MYFRSLVSASRLAVKKSWDASSIYDDSQGPPDRGEPSCTDTAGFQAFQRVDWYNVAAFHRLRVFLTTPFRFLKEFNDCVVIPTHLRARKWWDRLYPRSDTQQPCPGWFRTHPWRVTCYTRHIYLQRFYRPPAIGNNPYNPPAVAVPNRLSVFPASRAVQRRKLHKSATRKVRRTQGTFACERRKEARG